MKWLDPALAREFAAAGTDAYRILDAEGLWMLWRWRYHLVFDGGATGIVGELAGWGERAGVDVQGIYGRRLVTAPAGAMPLTLLDTLIRITWASLGKKGSPMRLILWPAIPAACFLIKSRRRRVRADVRARC